MFFHLWFHALNLLYVVSRQKQVTDVSLVLKDSDMESENPSSLIRLSENRQLKSCIIYRYIIKKKLSADCTCRQRVNMDSYMDSSDWINSLPTSVICFAY